MSRNLRSAADVREELPRSSREAVRQDEYTIIPNRNYTAGEVARLVLRIAPDTFRHHRKALMAEGFPRPISNAFLAPWYGQDLIDWLARDKSEARASVFAKGRNITRITDVLRERAAKLASAK